MLFTLRLTYVWPGKTHAETRDLGNRPFPDARAATVPGSIDYRNDTAKTQAQWLTNCFFAFAEAMRGQE